MSSSRILKSTLFACGAALLTGCAGDSADAVQAAMAAGNTITGEGLPNPAPTVVQSKSILSESTAPPNSVSREATRVQRGDTGVIGAAGYNFSLNQQKQQTLKL